MCQRCATVQAFFPEAKKSILLQLKNRQKYSLKHINSYNNDFF